MVPSLELKTKVNVVHVGLSQLLVLLKDIQKTIKVTSKTSLNNNLLTVQDHMEITTVTEVLWTMLSLTLEITVSHSKMNILIVPEKMLVKKIVETIKSVDSLMFQVETVTHLLQPSKTTSFQLPSMPQTSNSIAVVSSLTVVLD